MLDNAIKFTPRGGRIDPSAPLRSGTASSSGWRTPARALCRTASPELFEPFHQLDGSATRRHGGTGLGLTLVKMILEAHGTSVEVDTAPGAGSRFRFDLPAVHG